MATKFCAGFFCITAPVATVTRRHDGKKIRVCADCRDSGNY